jgi:hypothetical protein
MTVATTEPASERAGDTWAWRREDLTEDYPASEWTLVYAFKNEAGGFEISASADDDYFAVSVGSATTVAYTVGTYQWQARVSNIADSTIKHTVDEGTLEILKSFFTTPASTAYDGRSFARQMLADVEAALLAVASQRTTRAGIKSYSIGNRSIEYSDTDTEIARLEKSRDRWLLAVAREDQKEGRPNNRGRDRGVRFARA